MVYDIERYADNKRNGEDNDNNYKIWIKVDHKSQDKIEPEVLAQMDLINLVRRELR